MFAPLPSIYSYTCSPFHCKWWEREGEDRDGFFELFKELGNVRESKSLSKDDEVKFLPSDGEELQGEDRDGESGRPDQSQRQRLLHCSGRMRSSGTGSEFLWVRQATIPRRRSAPDGSFRHGTPATRCLRRRSNGFSLSRPLLLRLTYISSDCYGLNIHF